MRRLGIKLVLQMMLMPFLGQALCFVLCFLQTIWLATALQGAAFSFSTFLSFMHLFQLGILPEKKRMWYRKKQTLAARCWGADGTAAGVILYFSILYYTYYTIPCYIVLYYPILSCPILSYDILP